MIATDGLLDGLTWLVIAAAVLIAVAVQASVAAGIEPPLSLRKIAIRAVGAGFSALTCGLLMVGSGKFDLNWALYIGLGGILGFLGLESLDLAAAYIRKKLGIEDKKDDKKDDQGNDEGGGEA